MTYLLYNHSMDESRPFFRDPKKQVVIVILIVAVVYLFLLGHQGIARDVLVDGDYAYVAVGQYGGVRMLDVYNPILPREVGSYETVGTAKALAKVGQFLFIADGERGMEVLDVTDPSRPVFISSFNTAGDTQDVAIAGTYAYLACGEGGLVVVDVSNPAHPMRVASVNLPGPAQGLAVVPVTPANPVPGAPPGGQAAFVFIAAGGKGLQIIDAQLPIAPRLVGEVSLPGDARDVTVVGPFAYVAAGKKGIRVVDVSRPDQPQTASDISVGGDANHVVAVGNVLYVADGSGGLLLLNISQPANPVKLLSYNTHGIAASLAVKSTIVFVANSDQGVNVVDVNNPNNPHTISMYETPGEASLSQILSAMWSAVHGDFSNVQSKVWKTILLILFDLLLLGLIVSFWLAVFAQFVLPVKSLRDRRRAIERLFNYHMGMPGPAVFIENGTFREREREENRHGPGVALLDTASAAVFRNEHAFTQVAGPGVVFTRNREYPAGAVDLHKQGKSLGPAENDDPFAPQGQNESLEDYEDRQNRRYSTSGLTRDGVEVVANIGTSFTLNSTPGEGRSEFGYNPQSVWRAIAREGIDPSAPPGSDKRRVPWDWLPVYVAVDLWREYLRKFTLDELFSYPAAGETSVQVDRKTAFNTIMEMMRDRMNSPEVEELDELGKPTGILKPSKEYEVLRERGIKVQGVGVRRLLLPAKVETQLVDQWKASWLKRAQDETKEIEKMIAEARNNGQDLGLKEFSASVSQALSNALETDENLGMAASLETLAQGTLKLTLREPDLASRLTNQKTTLVELVEWIRKQ